MPAVIRLGGPTSHCGPVTDCCATNVKASGKPMAVVSFPVTAPAAEIYGQSVPLRAHHALQHRSNCPHLDLE